MADKSGRIDVGAFHQRPSGFDKASSDTHGQRGVDNRRPVDAKSQFNEKESDQLVNRQNPDERSSRRKSNKHRKDRGGRGGEDGERYSGPNREKEDGFPSGFSGKDSGHRRSQNAHRDDNDPRLMRHGSEPRSLPGYQDNRGRDTRSMEPRNQERNPNRPPVQPYQPSNLPPRLLNKSKEAKKAEAQANENLRPDDSFRVPIPSQDWSRTLPNPRGRGRGRLRSDDVDRFPRRPMTPDRPADFCPRESLVFHSKGQEPARFQDGTEEKENRDRKITATPSLPSSARSSREQDSVAKPASSLVLRQLKDKNNGKTTWLVLILRSKCQNSDLHALSTLWVCSIRPVRVCVGLASSNSPLVKIIFTEASAAIEDVETCFAVDPSKTFRTTVATTASNGTGATTMGRQLPAVAKVRIVTIEAVKVRIATIEAAKAARTIAEILRSGRGRIRRATTVADIAAPTDGKVGGPRKAMEGIRATTVETTGRCSVVWNSLGNPRLLRVKRWNLKFQKQRAVRRAIEELEVGDDATQRAAQAIGRHSCAALADPDKSTASSAHKFELGSSSFASQFSAPAVQSEQPGKAYRRLEFQQSPIRPGDRTELLVELYGGRAPHVHGPTLRAPLFADSSVVQSVQREKRKMDAVYYYMRCLMSSNPMMNAREGLITVLDENRKKNGKPYRNSGPDAARVPDHSPTFASPARFHQTSPNSFPQHVRRGSDAA
ncbi:unnamed protein product [Nesidiocoris tenuis]|uniref:DNA/RNA-binding domain-containing protein n=1 Tax=Nesidiocoris tenuis TaxID=355587 RepID=A0A6H5GPN1_9HEMI|nr:unnamed protein product [Nesidiocoris tenuis]